MGAILSAHPVRGASAHLIQRLPRGCNSIHGNHTYEAYTVLLL